MHTYYYAHSLMGAHEANQEPHAGMSNDDINLPESLDYAKSERGRGLEQES
jgi:hypothetical protein